MLVTKAMGGIIVAEPRILRTLGGKSCDWKPQDEDLTMAGKTSPVRVVLLYRELSYDPVYIISIYNRNNCRGLGNELVSGSRILIYLGSPDVSLEEMQKSRKIISFIASLSLLVERF